MEEAAHRLLQQYLNGEKPGSLCFHAPLSFLALFALTMSSLQAKSGKFERGAQVRGFSPPQGEDAPHKTQRIGARPAMQ
jgi:hypothetical protein